MSTVIVTGAAGHVGANLVRALLARGEKVRALVHRDQRALEGFDVEIARGDVRDIDSLLHAFAGVDLVYHSAAYISLSDDEWAHLEAVNILGTRNVVDACLESGVQRLAHFSSIEVLLGKPNGRRVDESCPVIESRHHTPYTRSKAAGELEVRRGLERGLDTVILYPSGIIGPYDYRLGFPNAGLLAILSGKLWGLIEGGFDWVDARDVVDGALQAAACAPSGARYILSAHWASLRDLAELAEEIGGTRVPHLLFPIWLARIGAPFVASWSRLSGKRPLYTRAALQSLVGDYRFSHQLATRDLDYHPRPLRETVQETRDWFMNNGLLPPVSDLSE